MIPESVNALSFLIHPLAKVMSQVAMKVQVVLYAKAVSATILKSKRERA